MGDVSLQLDLVKDTGRYLVADYDGAEYWFDKMRVDRWDVQGDQLFVTLPEKKWQRRLNAARVKEEVVETTAKTCLCCKSSFQAEKNQYVCTPCKSTKLWSMGSTVFTN